MRILHAPVNLAGQPYVLSRALRQLGHQSDVLVEEQHPYGYPADILYNYDHLRSPWRQLRKGFAFWKLLRSYDVFHFYFGGSLLPNFRDLPVLKKARKRIVFHFRGCEIRMRRQELARGIPTACSDCPAPCRSDPEKEALRAIAREYSDALLVATPDLLDWVPEAHLVTQAFDLAQAPEPTALPERDTFTILHAPSDPLIKGTSYIEQAVANLQAQGYPVTLRLLTNVSHEDLQWEIRSADLVVDQVMAGWYGNFAIEGMAANRPVVAYLRDGLPEKAGYRPPIANATPATLEAVLRSLLDNETERSERGLAGRSFVERHHNAKRIAERLLEEHYAIPRRYS